MSDYKEILTKDEYFEYIVKGINKIADIVSRTLGPGGLPILIERKGTTPTGDPLAPLITKDGVTVANACFDKDPRVDLVIQAVKAVCQKTNQSAGDGTTTAIVLGRKIFLSAMERLKRDPSLNPQAVRESIDAAYRLFLTHLGEAAIPVNDVKRISDVATISANGDRSIGDVIQQAFDKVGAEGVITVDEGHSSHTTIDIVDGFQVKRGAESHDRFFNNQDRTKFEAENVRVLLFDGPLRSFTDIRPFFLALEKEAAEQNRNSAPPLLVIANEFSSEVLQCFLIMKFENGLSICAVKSPHATHVRTSMLDDMSVLLGGSRMGNGNRNLESIEPSDIGLAKRVVVEKYTTTFYGGAGGEEAVLDRVEQLKALRRNAESPYDASLLSDRIASLAGGIAKIGVGGSTDLEVKERYHRIEDALNAARAAVEEGIVPGGGTTLIRIANKIQAKGSVTVGEEILIESLLEPFMKILENVGLKSSTFPGGFEAFRKLLLKDATTTFDAHSKTTVNALDAGIVDPVKVIRVALENAISVASLLSTYGGAIINLRD